MTLPPLSQPMTYWTIAIDHEDGYNGWPVKASPPEVFVSAKGYPTVKSWAQFRSKADAELFLERNREAILRRCGSKRGFHGLAVTSGSSLWPVVFDRPGRIARRRKSR